MKVHFNHVGITVRNLDTSLEFYRDMFGLEAGMTFHVTAGTNLQQSLRLPEHTQRIALLPIDDVVIELIEFTPTRREEFDGRQDDTGYAYISFQVDDLDALYERLSAKGVEFTAPPRIAPDHHPVSGSKYAFAKDPDGKNIELVQMGPGMHVSKIHAAAAAGPATLDAPIIMGESHPG